MEIIKTINKNKKAMFFTLMSILLVSGMIVSFTTVTNYRYYNKMKVIETRAITMNNYIDNVERDMERATYIAGFRALVSIDNVVVSNGTFVENIDKTFYNAMTNGTVFGQPQPLLKNQTLTAWKQKIKAEVSESDILVNISISNITLKHTSPWELEVSAIMNFTLTDSFKTAEWKRDDVKISSKMSIIGFEDPIYAYNTNGRITRQVEKTSINDWDAEHILRFLENGTYRHNTDAPSFLMRLTNNMSSSKHGIESLVNTKELLIYELGAKANTSSADYLYWGNGGLNNSYIEGVSDEGHPFFMLDEEHLHYYGVRNDTYG